MTVKHLLLAVAGGAAIWHWAQRQQQLVLERKLARSAAKPEAVTTWEGEGGALPDSGPQLRPDASSR